MVETKVSKNGDQKSLAQRQDYEVFVAAKDLERVTLYLESG